MSRGNHGLGEATVSIDRASASRPSTTIITSACHSPGMSSQIYGQLRPFLGEKMCIWDDKGLRRRVRAFIQVQLEGSVLYLVCYWVLGAFT